MPKRKKRQISNGKSDEKRWVKIEYLSLFLVISSAIFLRIIYLIQYESAVPFYHIPVVDSDFYHQWAMRAANGEGYGPKPYYLAPLYPYMLAFIYMIAGHNLTTAYIFQNIIGVATLVLTYLIGKRIFGHGAGLLAVVITTLYAPLIHMESKFLTEPLAIMLNLVGILLLMLALEKPSILRFLFAGVMFGLAVVCRPVAFIAVGLIVIWLILSKYETKNFRKATVFVIGLGLVILPFTIRNYAIGQDKVLIASVAGIVFAQGNNQSATGTYSVLPGFSGAIATQQEEEISIAEEALGRTLKPSESSNYWLRKGLEFIRNNPDDYARLLLKKGVLAIHSNEVPCNYDIYLEKELVPMLRYLFVPFSVLFGLGLWGFTRAKQVKSPGYHNLLALYVISIILGLMIFFVTYRYRAPIVPALAIFAGYGIIQGLEVIRQRNIFAILAMILCVVPVTVFGLTSQKNIVSSDTRVNLASAFLEMDEIDKAVSHLLEALDEKYDSPLAHFKLGYAYEKKGDISLAEKHYLEVIELQPENSIARFNLANTLVWQDRIDEALPYYLEAVRLEPSNANYHYNLAVVLESKGRLDEAVKHFKEAVKIKPNFSYAHNKLAINLYLTGEYHEAWKHVKLSQEYGYVPGPKFIKALTLAMPEPLN